jgi:hypothetical protein
MGSVITQNTIMETVSFLSSGKKIRTYVEES